MTNQLKFFYNGIKANGGALQKCHYSIGNLVNFPAGTITIYAKDYSGFDSAVKKAFTVENNSETMTDYFETDKIRVLPTHPLYAEVLAALEKGQERIAKKAAA